LGGPSGSKIQPTVPGTCLLGTLCWTNRNFVQQWPHHGKDIVEQVGDTSREIRSGHREAGARWPDGSSVDKQGPLRIEADTDLVEFALATVALEDNFAQVFKTSRGKVDPELKLGF
jgi:hypothetical protein